MSRRSRASSLLASLLVAAPLALAGPAAHAAVVAPAGAGRCVASVSPSNPRQYSYVDVNVRGVGKGARVRTTAHYKTTDTRRETRADKNGRASTEYYISGATVGYRVYVDVWAKKGTSTWTCRTSFVPRSR